MSKKLPIKERIALHYTPFIDYYYLQARVFPPEEYPKAYNRASHGGPAGCSMAFSKAIRELAGVRDLNNEVYIPCLSGTRGERLKLKLRLSPLPPPTGKIYRASGDAVCEKCGFTFKVHPEDPEMLGWDEKPHVQVLCSGDRVHL